MKRVFIAVVALACATMVTSCNGKKATITQGDPAKMDSLSYCMGVNVGSSVKMQLSDVPFSLEEIEKGVAAGLTKTAEQSHEEAIEILQEFFAMQLGERRQAIKMYAADSTSSATAPQIFENTDECNSVSYAFGNDLGTNMRSSKLPLQIYWFQKGFNDS